MEEGKTVSMGVGIRRPEIPLLSKSLDIKTIAMGALSGKGLINTINIAEIMDVLVCVSIDYFCTKYNMDYEKIKITLGVRDVQIRNEKGDSETRQVSLIYVMDDDLNVLESMSLKKLESLLKEPKEQVQT